MLNWERSCVKCGFEIEIHPWNVVQAVSSIINGNF